MKTDKEDMLKTYNEFKALCLEKGYEFKFGGIQQFINAEYAVLNYWKKIGENEETGTQLTIHTCQNDVLDTMKKLYESGIDNLTKYG